MLLLLVFFNFVCIIFGTIEPLLRVAGSACAFCLCLSYFGVMIATAVYRFGKWGQLCALYMEGTNAKKVNEPVGDDWTYAKDASMIMVFWVIQLLGSWTCCVVGIVMPMRPSKSVEPSAKDTGKEMDIEADSARKPKNNSAAPW